MRILQSWRTASFHDEFTSQVFGDDIEAQVDRTDWDIYSRWHPLHQNIPEMSSLYFFEMD
jgi:hypothetical protein